MMWRRLGRGFFSSAWAGVPARVLVAAVFMFAGFSKLLLPHAEVMALVQQYEVIPAAVIPFVATYLPWIEVLSGTALLMGFFTTSAALIVALQLVSFSLLMVVVILSGVVIEDCGCFGNLGWKETPLHVLIRDIVMLGLVGVVLMRRRDAWALDAWIREESDREGAGA
jgi:uncharacterized membrane protein YphA (DoxX/SURF4 family)